MVKELLVFMNSLVKVVEPRCINDLLFGTSRALSMTQPRNSKFLHPDICIIF